MSEWVDVVVYAAFVVAVWGWLPAWSSRLTMPVIADRNPEWMAAHPEIARRFAESRWFRRSCLLWGALSLATLSAFQAGAWLPPLAFLRATPRWEALKDLNSVLFMIGLAYVAGCAVLFYRWLDQNVPLAARRQASLGRRSLHDHVPQALQHAVYAVIVLHLASWVAVGATGGDAAPAFWGGLAFQFAISGVFLSLVMIAVRRRPGAMDRIFGSRYRRTEVRAAFAAQLLPLMNGVARLYEQVADTPPENVDRLLHLGLVLLVVALVMALTAWFPNGGESGPSRWFRSATSAVAVAFIALTQVPAHDSAPSTQSADTTRALPAARDSIRAMVRVRRVLLWVAGTVFVLGVAVLSVGLWWVGSWYQSEQADPARAGAAFGEVRGRFAGVLPALEIRDDRLVVVKEPTGTSESTPAAVHMMVWDPDRRTLSQVRLPFSISTVATEPLPLEALAGVANEGLAALMQAQGRGNELNIRLTDLERYGRMLLLDGVAPDGKHILMWNE